MQELTSDGKSGRYPKSRLFGYLLWWCWVGSALLRLRLRLKAMTSDGKPGRYPKSRLFGYLLWW